jgi:hypothetical protein
MREKSFNWKSRIEPIMMWFKYHFPILHSRLLCEPSSMIARDMLFNSALCVLCDRRQNVFKIPSILIPLSLYLKLRVILLFCDSVLSLRSPSFLFFNILHRQTPLKQDETTRNAPFCAGFFLLITA